MDNDELEFYYTIDDNEYIVFYLNLKTNNWKAEKRDLSKNTNIQERIAEVLDEKIIWTS